MTPIKTVAFIGVGNMGAPMARCARRAGFELIVCDRNPDVLAAFAQEGVRVTASISDCAAADAVVVLLANDAQIMETMLGGQGLAQAVPAGHRPIVCMMSTTLPDTLRALEAPLAAVGARLVDAPVSGGIVGAEAGTLTIMMGGETADVEAVRPLMQAMGERLFHCGALGSAEIAKVINNMLCVANMFLTAEAIELAESHGVAFESLTPILSVSTGLNFLTADAPTARAQYGAWARSEQAYAAIHQIVGKDLHLALKLAQLASLDLGLLKSVSQYVDADDPQAMARWMRGGRAASAA
ncbi:NAD(P)-dependent oxidoreductase [Bordetella parapertussis]|uniref:NAD(P)-dependent oxidoreductase n=7 Tax=Bordetella TaxID=517 RepID=K0M815_BORPB|nr:MULTISPECIES: NAD(P)-dependent oxidoreductase [Bordetella]KAK60836.1 NADP oxidoreductase coenzyme F420-dependent [Bordetella bronchiseptica 980-2]SHQ19354.1 6-phosphogluconate dehydrogenase [Mycobacteroides abscessus subsp. abscessus]AMG86940.1 NAD(P)-dependent oxidoreductase [Bordetella bronchiseptica]AOB37724.1 6-phosphogluconate dehydrogenase [Bordetella parapertussis]AUL41685.1 6-phosphogluconate dehydrogenase [Bordetella parapertussis]